MKVYHLKRKTFFSCQFFSLMVLIQATSYGQINIIDVPTSDISEKGHLFFQQEVKVGNRNIQAANIFTWGLGKNIEAGFNIHQITFNTRPDSRILIINAEEPENTPDLKINVQKGFNIKEWLKFGIGTQTGLNIASSSSELKLSDFSYINSQLSVPDTKSIFVLGGYYTTPGYAGAGNRWGLMFGAEAEIFKDKFSLIGDFISGNSSISVINTGIEISLPKNWQIDLAFQFPVPGSNNHHGGVLQICRK